MKRTLLDVRDWLKDARDWSSDTWDAIKEQFGCPKSRIKLHSYYWGMGPDAEVAPDGLVLKHGGGWWMYCTKCGKPVGVNKDADAA
jgi:hypothetical protein